MAGFQRLSAHITQQDNQVNRISTQLPSTPPIAQLKPPAPSLHQLAPQPKEPLIPDPERYAGDLGTCKSFLIQCSLVFEQQSLTYSTDRANTAYIIVLLRGNALAWASAVWESPAFASCTSDNFISEIRGFYPVRGRDAAQCLFSLRQGSRCVAEFSVEFKRIVWII